MNNQEFLSEIAEKLDNITDYCSSKEAKEVISEIIINSEIDPQSLADHHVTIKSLVTMIYQINYIMNQNPEAAQAFMTLYKE